MTSYLQFPLDDGDSVIIEIEELDDADQTTGGLVPASRGTKKVLATAERSFASAVDNVRNAANVLVDKLKALHESPDEIEVTFGLKATGELGGNFVVAKAGLEANYIVKLKWTKDEGS